MAFLHELGHALLLGGEPGQMKRIANEFDYLPGFERYRAAMLNLKGSDLEAGQRINKIEKLTKTFVASLDYRRLIGASMKFELETWIFVIQLIDRLGVRGLFEDEEALMNHIYWCIKTRLSGIR